MIRISGGSVPGTDHTKPGQPGWTNNHDAFTWRNLPKGGVVAVVSDGCGSGKHSEVGSALGANLFAQIIADEMAKGGNIHLLSWPRIQQLVVSHLSVMARAMGGSLSQTVNEYYLFTVVGAIVTPEDYYIFSLGDGVYIVNGKVNELGPFPNNSPPYLMYNLVGSSLSDNQPDLLNIRVEVVGNTDELKWLLLGTDGVNDLIHLRDQLIPGREEKVGPVEQFLSESCMSNSDGIRRRLSVINRETIEGGRTVKGGLLKDDTTLVVIQNI